MKRNQVRLVRIDTGNPIGGKLSTGDLCDLADLCHNEGFPAIEGRLLSAIKEMPDRVHRVYDHTERDDWTGDIDRWETRFNDGDVVVHVGYDPETFEVSQIDFDDPAEYVHRRGVFWDKDEAWRYAEVLADDE